MPNTPVEVTLTEACWAMLREDHPELGPLRLSSDVRKKLDDPSRIPVEGPASCHLLVVEMLRLHAWELLDYLGAIIGFLPAEDPRRVLCIMCLDAIEGSIKGAQAAKSPRAVTTEP